MVRLEEREEKKQNWMKSLFQFQYGAIRSEYDCYSEGYTPLFQFQYGAIRRM